ncbi:hypothetical protein LCGC14_0990690 [marine sediment metagenome]|uniref:Uncharacterized protein n=1 Tax=marine sediment metagenome TaxID=412755 RepID=A0A0F9RCI2_9ZZZZ
MEKVRNKISLDVKEFYFNDGMELYIVVKNKPSDKYSLKSLQFGDLTTNQKRAIKQILKSKL